MHRSFIKLLDESKYKDVSLNVEDDEIINGVLFYNGGEIQIENGVPVFFCPVEDAKDEIKKESLEEQIKTNESFSAKWNLFKPIMMKLHWSIICSLY